MQFFGIDFFSRNEKSETLKRIIESLQIWREEKDLYIVSLDILNDSDFNVFFDSIVGQIDTNKSTRKEHSIAPLTQQII
jgi:hypothetical protein